MNINLLQGRVNVTSVAMISSASLLQEGSGAPGDGEARAAHQIRKVSKVAALGRSRDKERV